MGRCSLGGITAFPSTVYREAIYSAIPINLANPEVSRQDESVTFFAKILSSSVFSEVSEWNPLQ